MTKEKSSSVDKIRAMWGRQDAAAIDPPKWAMKAGNKASKPPNQVRETEPETTASDAPKRGGLTLKKKPKAEPARLVHPAQHLAELMEPMGLTTSKLAASMGLPRNQLRKFLRQGEPLSAEIAIRLEGVLESPTAEVWMKMQVACDLAKAKTEIDMSEVTRVSPSQIDSAD